MSELSERERIVKTIENIRRTFTPESFVNEQIAAWHMAEVARIVKPDLIKELELLKSYFEGSKEVVLNFNDIKWKVIDDFIKCMQEANNGRT